MFINNMYYLFSVSFMTLWSKLILTQVTFNIFSALPKRIIYKALLFGSHAFYTRN